MKEYIEREALMDEIHNHYEVRNAKQNATMDEVCMIVFKQPAADVVPRAEVAKEIFEKIEELFFDQYLLGNITASLFEDKFADLKKKYTEVGK